MSLGRILESVRARHYRAPTVDNLKMLLDGHDPVSPVRLRNRSGGLPALNDMESRPMTRHGTTPGSRATDSVKRAITLALPAGEVVVRSSADGLWCHLVGMISSVWLRIEAHAADNIHRQFHRLDREDDEHSL